MTTPELCESSGVSLYRVQLWLQTGLLEAETVGISGGGRRFEFAAGQLARARLLKELARKGVPLARLAAADLAFDNQAYVVFDGDKLRACRDATVAIGTIVRARRWCSAIDLSAVRQS
jgi:hypothetical protein